MTLKHESAAFLCHNRLRCLKATVLLSVMLTALSPQITAAPQGEALVQAFGEGCLPRDLGFERSIGHARDLGWREASDDDNPELEGVIDKAKGKHEISATEGWIYQVLILKKQISGHEIYLVKKKIVVPDSGTMRKCFVYDFAATQPIAPDGLNRLLDQQFTESSLDKTSTDYINPRLTISYEWAQPDQKIWTQLLFISELSPLVILTRYNGLMIGTVMPEPPTENPK